MPQLHSASTGKPVIEDAEAPTGGPGRLPATGDAKVPLDASWASGGLGRLGVDGADRGHGDLGRLGILGGRWGALDAKAPLETLDASGVPGALGCLGVDGERRGPRRL